MVTNDCHDQFPVAHQIAASIYLELNSSNNEGDLYYLDNKRKPILSAFCVVANYPPPEIAIKKKQGM